MNKTLITTAIASIMLLASTSHANTLQHVTIYQNRALVERNMPAVAGTQTLIFDCLSHHLDQNSLQVAAANATIMDIQIKQIDNETSNRCSDTNDKQQHLNDINARLQAAETTLAFLKNLSSASNLNLNQSIKDSAKELNDEMVAAALTIQALNAQKQQLTQTFGAQSEHGSTQVHVRLQATAPTQATLSYIVSGVQWQPSYQAQLNTKTNTLTIALQAQISQRTGENWQNTPITLSTSQPSRRTAASTPRRRTFTLKNDEPILTRNALGRTAPEMLMAAAPIAAEDSDYHISQSQIGDIISYQPSATLSLNSGDSTTLGLDNSRMTADIFQRINLDDQTAYWYARTTPTQTVLQWVPAAMQLYRDGHFVGTGRFNGNTLANEGLGFGINQQILVSAIDAKQSDGSLSLSGNRQSKKYSSHFTITNRMSTAAKLEILSGIPTAGDDKINVQLDYTPTPDATTWQGVAGIAVWTPTLHPNQNFDIHQNHNISYPKDEILIGSF